MEIAQSEAAVVNNNIPIDRSKIASKAAKWWQITIAGIGLSILGALGWQNYQLSQKLAIARQDLTKTKVALDRQIDSTEKKLLVVISYQMMKFVST